jgi:putative DNA primase/helicase
LHAARLKAFTGGDPIACRPICRAPFFFRPCAKIILVANRELDVHDEALTRRIRVVPFDHQVSEGKRDPHLVDKLAAELPGILNRLVPAGAEYAAGKIRTPEAVLRATTGYFFEKDHVASYLEERVEKAPGCDISKTWVYESYLEWCKTECRQPLSKRELTRVLRKKGLEDKHTNAGAAWRNVRVVPCVSWAEDPDVDIAALMSTVANTA